MTRFAHHRQTLCPIPISLNIWRGAPHGVQVTLTVSPGDRVHVNWLGWGMSFPLYPQGDQNLLYRRDPAAILSAVCLSSLKTIHLVIAYRERSKLALPFFGFGSKGYIWQCLCRVIKTTSWSHSRPSLCVDNKICIKASSNLSFNSEPFVPGHTCSPKRPIVRG